MHLPDGRNGFALMSQVYVHRSGRTARARSEGLSLMLVGPRDVRFYQQICKQLNKGTIDCFGAKEYMRVLPILNKS